MFRRFDKPLLIDMLQSPEKVLEFTAGMDEEAFCSKENVKTRDAVIYNIQIIGEAASHISERLVQRKPEVEWGKIMRTRHRIVHDYD